MLDPLLLLDPEPTWLRKAAANPPITQCPFSYFPVISTSSVVLRELEGTSASLPEVAIKLPNPMVNREGQVYSPPDSLGFGVVRLAVTLGSSNQIVENCYEDDLTELLSVSFSAVCSIRLSSPLSIMYWVAAV